MTVGRERIADQFNDTKYQIRPKFSLHWNSSIRMREILFRALLSRYYAQLIHPPFVINIVKFFVQRIRKKKKKKGRRGEEKNGMDDSFRKR